MARVRAKLKPWCQEIVDQAKAEGFTVADLARHLGRRGMDQSNIYRWGKKPEAEVKSRAEMLRRALQRLITAHPETVDRPVNRREVAEAIPDVAELRGVVLEAMGLLNRAVRLLSGNDPETDRTAPRLPANDAAGDRRLGNGR